MISISSTGTKEKEVLRRQKKFIELGKLSTYTEWNVSQHIVLSQSLLSPLQDKS